MVSKFDNLSFDKFREFAQNASLSQYEKIGFPDSYRKGKEEGIFNDIRTKLLALDTPGTTIFDIGPGCSDLPRLLLNNAEKLGQRLIFVDSPEMLAMIPDKSILEKIPARFPDCKELIARFSGQVDAIIVYSVIQYVFVEGSVFGFLDRVLSLLAPGGGLLIGDIPNISRRKRFFSSEAGIAFHKNFIGTDIDPDVTFNNIETDQLDDTVVLALISRARLAGFDAFIVPQGLDLPMANRREDVLIIRP